MKTLVLLSSVLALGGALSDGLTGMLLMYISGVIAGSAGTAYAIREKGAPE